MDVWCFPHRRGVPLRRVERHGSKRLNVCAALKVAKRLERGCVVTIAADRGDRYFAPMKWEKKYVW